MQLEWRDEADADLFEILSYIAVRNFEAAFELKESIERSIEHLAEHPYLYKPSMRKLGWREIVVQPNYIVFYKVTDKVYIMAVAHSRQMYPG